MAKKRVLSATSVAGLSSPVSYTIAEHHHRFAAWAAARAALRGLADIRTGTISHALEHCGVVGVVDTRARWPTSVAVFDAAHRDWCQALLKDLRSAGTGNASYGRAAKVLAIYLKSRIVLGGHHAHAFAKVIHPPIDRILLQGIAEHVCAGNQALAKQLRTTTWTTLTAGAYYDLIDRLRGADLDRRAFWGIEQFWDPGREEA